MSTKQPLETRVIQAPNLTIEQVANGVLGFSGLKGQEVTLPASPGGGYGFGDGMMFPILAAPERVARAHTPKLSDTHCAITEPSFMMGSAMWVAEVHALGNDEYRLERHKDFPSGKTLAEFDPAE